MSTILDLPASCRKRYDYSQPWRISGRNLAKAGQAFGAAITWTQIPDADVTAFVDATAGIVEVFTVMGVPAARVVPLRHPRYSKLIATDIEVEALKLHGADPADPDGPAVPLYWRATVTFSSPDFDLDGNSAFLSESVSPSTRAIQAPSSMMRIGGVAPIYDPGREVPGFTASYTTHNLPSLNLSVYQGLTGHVNSSAFLGCATGTVLYRGPGGQRESTLGLTKTYDITHNFDISEVPWNSGYTASGTIAELTDASGARRHVQSNLALVFG